MQLEPGPPGPSSRNERKDLMKTRLLLSVTLACLVTALCVSPALAQTVTGSITGVVTDPSGAVVVGASVIAENAATGVKTRAQANGAGAYTIRFLPIGTYTLSVDAKGFARARLDGITLEIDQTATINV